MTSAAPDTVTSESDLASQVLSGDRRALARAITLIESERADHRAEAENLLRALLPAAGKAVRLGISGAPGVGKSTFIEALGLHLIDQGKKVAVLAVDPTSQRSGGSILGDKTRMEKLARSDDAFIRPSPAGRTLGGVARRTREAMLLCEAAGYGVVITETVGVGQSETAVAAMVDMFLLLIAPGGGDELQGIKRGIVELADLILVNKSDGDLAPAAGRIAAEYAGALSLLRPATPEWQATVQQCSALLNRSIAKVWDTAEAHQKALTESGALQDLRARQSREWMWNEVTEDVLAGLRGDAAAAAALPDLERKVGLGEMLPSAAARVIVAAYRKRPE